MKLSAILLVLVVICLILAALCWAAEARGVALKAIAGGAPRRPRLDPAKSPHLVVDTLNLAHWYMDVETLTPELIAQTISATAPALKLRHPGRVMYVLKDRESCFNNDRIREIYRKVAVENAVYIMVAERYPDPPAGGAKPSAEHSSRGRDDFFMSLLAHNYRCPVVTGDRLKDFDQFRKTIPPFHTIEYAFWRAAPYREYIRPDSPTYRRLRKPLTIRPAAYLTRPKTVVKLNKDTLAT